MTNLGAIVTCVDCGSQARAHTIAASTWQPGDVLYLEWQNGPYPRFDGFGSKGLPPERCAWCEDRRLGFPGITNRPIGDGPPWMVRGPALAFEVPKAGAPVPTTKDVAGALTEVRVEGLVEQLFGAPGNEIDTLLQPDNPPGPTESTLHPRFMDLAQAFFGETGMWPPGHPNDKNETGRADAWLRWCRKRNAATAKREATRRGQRSLF